MILAAYQMHLGVMASIRTRRCLKRRSLLIVEDSQWRKMWAFGDDDDLVETIGFDRKSAEEILAVFSPIFEKMWRGSRKWGRKDRKYYDIDAFGLLMQWINSTMMHLTN